MTNAKLAVAALLCLWGPSVGVALAQPAPQHGEEQFAPPQAFPRASETEAPPAGERPGPWGRRPGQGGFRRGDFQQRREEQRHRLEHARNVANRLLADPNTPADVKAKARRLAELLSKREDLEGKLNSKRQDFFRAHQQEIDELRQLQERADRIRRELRDAREKSTADNLSDIQEMRRVTKEARDIAQELRRQYQGRRGRERGDE